MTKEQTQQQLQGNWKSIVTELRPSAATGTVKPLYMYRTFNFAGDEFTCAVTNFADAGGKVPLVNILIKGHLVWQQENDFVKDAWNLDYVADIAYEITPLHAGFVAACNQFASADLNTWELNVTQDVKGKPFPLFGLTDAIYTDYDLVYILNDLLFMGAKHVDGRAFDKPENRPTNLQVPLIKS